VNWKLAAVLLPLLYLVFLVLGLPAAHLVTLLDPARGRVSLGAVEGTAWNGRAEGVRVSQLSLGGVTWRLAPLAFLTGCLEYRLGVESGPAGIGNGRVGACVGSRRYVKELTGDVSVVDLASAAGAAMALLAPRGRLELAVDSVRQRGEAYVDAEGRVVWRAAVVGQGQPVRLGDVAIDLAVDGERLAGSVRNTGGEVDLQGTLSVDPAGSYELQGRLKPRPGASLDEALSTVAARQPDGSYALRLKGTL
jgi:general secretion pathway protein N